MSKLDFQDTSNMLAQLGIGGPVAESEPKPEAKPEPVTTAPEQVTSSTITLPTANPNAAADDVSDDNAEPEPKPKKTGKGRGRKKAAPTDDNSEQPSKPPMYIRSTQTATNEGCIRFTCMITKELYAALRVKSRKSLDMGTSDHVCAALNTYLADELKEVDQYEIILTKPDRKKNQK